MEDPCETKKYIRHKLVRIVLKTKCLFDQVVGRCLQNPIKSEIKGSSCNLADSIGIEVEDYPCLKLEREEQARNFQKPGYKLFIPIDNIKYLFIIHKDKESLKNADYIGICKNLPEDMVFHIKQFIYGWLSETSVTIS